MTWIAAIVLIAMTLFLSAFFSGTETGLYCANRVRLHLKAQQRDPRGLRLAAILADEQGALIVTLIGVNLMDALTTNAVAYLFDHVMMLSPREVELYTVAVVAPLVFVAATVVPKNLYQLHADRLMLAGSGLFVLADRLFRLTGAVWCLRTISAWANRWTSDPSVDLAAFDPKWKVAVLLQESLAGKAHASDQSELIDRVLQLSEMSLQSVMVSAGRIMAIAEGANRNELVRMARATTFSRLPVHGANRRRIAGVINVDELLGSDDWRTVGERMEPVLHFGPYDTIATAIAALQRSGRRMAVVREGQGPVMGIVTLRTMLELMVGGLAIDD